MANPKQRRILLALESGVANAGLQKIVRRLKAANVDVADLDLNPWAINNALEAEYGDHIAKITIPTTDGPFDWEVAAPAVVLRSYCQSAALSPFIRDLVDAGVGCHPNNPLRLVFYCDELTPGRALKLHNKRKTMAMYVVFKDLPHGCRGHREAWVPLAFLRSSVVKIALEPWTSQFRALLENAFLGPDSIADQGFVLKLGGRRPITIFCTLDGVIGDAPALASFWGTKGCNGVMPCLKCLFVASVESKLEIEDDAIVDFSCTDRSKFGDADDEDVWEKFDELALQRPLLNKTRFGQLETAAGLNYVVGGVLACVPLRRVAHPVDHSLCDPMHVMVSNGFINFEVWEIFTSAGYAECYRDMRELAAASWLMPRFRKAAGVDLGGPFDAAHQSASRASTENKSRTFKCQASEMLSVLPLIRFYVDVKLSTRAELSAQVASFRAAHDLLCEVMDSKKSGDGDGAPDRIDSLAQTHVELFKTAYGVAHLKSKHHSEFHLGENARKCGGAMDCFAQERKAGHAKLATNHVDNTARFERSALRNTMMQDLRRLEDPTLWADKLLGKLEPFPELAWGHGARACWTTLKIQWEHVQYSAGDIVIVDDTPCRFECGARFEDARGAHRFAFLITACTDGVKVTETASRWKLSTDLEVLILWLQPGISMAHAVLWDVEDNDRVLVIAR